MTPPLLHPLPRNPNSSTSTESEVRESKLRVSAASTSTPALPHPLPRYPSSNFGSMMARMDLHRRAPRRICRIHFHENQATSFGRIDLHAGFAPSTSTVSKLRVSAASISTPALPHPLPRKPSLEFRLLRPPRRPCSIHFHGIRGPGI